MRSKKWVLGAASALALVAAVAVGTAVLFRHGPGPSAQAPAVRAGTGRSVGVAVETGTDPGQRAPEFSLVDLDGRPFSLSGLRGRPTVVYFSASWCLSCVPETQALSRLKAAYGPKVHVVWIDVTPGQDTVEDLRAYGQKYGHPDFIYALDTAGVALVYRARALGTTYLLDRDGIIRYRDFGPTGYERYAEELEKLL